jgi:hypothetical protein
VLIGPKYRHYVADSLSQAIDSILSKSKVLQAEKKQDDTTNEVQIY